MPSPRFEVPAGAIDGVNTVFTVSMPYAPGSTAVFLNGLLQERSLQDGWFETSPALGIITLKEPPSNISALDVIHVFFIDTSPALPETVVVNLKGKIRPRQVLRGTLHIEQPMHGHMTAELPLAGHFESRKSLRGYISTSPPMKSTIKECV